jgi:hypothetical protein
VVSLIRPVDTLDDRRELWHLLHRMHPVRRVRFLEWSCQTAAGQVGQRPTVSLFRMQERIREAQRDPSGKADEILTNEIYGDLIVLAAQWKLDLAAVCVAAEKHVKRPSEPMVLRTAPAGSASTPQTVASASSHAGPGRKSEASLFRIPYTA